MSTPKKGGKPIKITLTEGQISEIITQSARTRRGLKAESLEDRIAPSVLGAPLDPNLPPPEGEVPVLPEEPIDPLAPPAPFDPNLPQGDLLDPGTGDTLFPTDGGDGTVPTDPFAPTNFDPNNPFPNAFDPNNPFPNAFDPNNPLGSPVPPLPTGDPGAFGGEGDSLARFGRRHHFQQLGDPTTTDPRDLQHASERIARQLQNIADNGGTPPSPEELEHHRRNILKQLRGAEPASSLPPEPPVE
jgi:hypothetical protein